MQSLVYLRIPIVTLVIPENALTHYVILSTFQYDLIILVVFFDMVLILL